jgi:hypothetical protein
MKAILSALLLLIIPVGIFASGPVSDVRDDANTSGVKAAVSSIEGMVSDRVSGEALPGVKVKLDGSDVVRYTDFDGKFRIENLKPGNYTLKVEYISYESEKIEAVPADSKPGQQLKIRLQPSTVRLGANAN